MSLKYFKITGD